MSIVFNKTITKTIQNLSFGELSPETIKELFKDGRIFSHFMEHMLSSDYNLTHVTGCKGHDLVDPADNTIRPVPIKNGHLPATDDALKLGTVPNFNVHRSKYEQKTFTRGGCKFMPSNMIGQGRKFDKAIFDEKSKALNYIIVSNINFPEVKIRFMKGAELVTLYPKGEIPLKDHTIFFIDQPIPHSEPRLPLP